MALSLSSTARSKFVDALLSVIGTMRYTIYTGSAPDDPEDTPTGVDLVYDSSYDYDAASNGTASITGTASTHTAFDNGTAGYVEMRNAASTYRLYCSVGTAATNHVVVDTEVITSGCTVVITNGDIIQGTSL